MRNICHMFRVKHKKKWLKVERNGKDYRKEERLKKISEANSSPAWKTESWNITWIHWKEKYFTTVNLKIKNKKKILKINKTKCVRIYILFLIMFPLQYVKIYFKRNLISRNILGGKINFLFFFLYF